MKNHLWAIETTLKDSGEKYLAWTYRGGKSLYWTSDKKQMPPSLFRTKQEAYAAIKNNDKSKEKIPSGLFRNVYDTAQSPRLIKVTIAVLN